MSGILQLPQIEATNTMGDGAQPVYMPPSPTRQLREALDQCTPTNGIAPAKTPSGPGEVTPQGTPERVKGLVAQWQRGHAPAFPQQASTPSSLGGAYVEVSCASVLNAEGAGGIGAQEGSGSGKLGMQEDILAPLGSGAVLETPAAAGDGSHNNFSSPLASLTQGTTSTSSTVTASPGRHDPPVVYSKPTPAGPPEEGAGGLQRGLSGTGTQLQVPAPVISMTLEHGDRPVPVSRSSPPLVAMDAKNVERSSDENNMTFRNMYMIQEVQAAQAYTGGSGWLTKLTSACDAMCMSFDCCAFDVADDWVSAPAKQKAEEWASLSPTTAPLPLAPRVAVTPEGQ
uniref:Uncharacterized protein n=1 Tax=Hemiselmis andersenii TaxID=464988 RepID=A0A6U2GB07_HEMAN|mmetsp:Transcript_36333/g.85252  ORF Transcript_36333/g.85252 Transcript_36333/m.85252 type:complete len:341 (+) Transcript_36333:81-1103(+)|eukprot:CAMPEP_0172012250 /NCGR_PEP_ID=MMETSP1041-20130122/8734_1 /TAXON_ID=464988 /ORGANISM="Hemiselmis andersenii, Strain CCMP439" /LENGTH=340 /DNA_ID=CAMNT_0012666807 /DNA_START=60 /DNA_END=1082 /DNA_ORIENTATION=-